MAGTRPRAVRVLAAAGAVATVAVLAALSPSCSDSDPGESESAPVTSGAPPPAAPSAGRGATEDGPDAAVATGTGEEAPTGSGPPPTTSLNADPGSEDAAEAPAEDPADSDPDHADHADSDPGSAVKPSADDPLDSDPELAVEIIEELAPAEPAGGARQEGPLEPVESGEDGTGDSGRETSTPGEAYTWHDGDRVLEAVLQPDLTVISQGEAAPGQDDVGGTGQGRIVTREDGDPRDVEGDPRAQRDGGTEGGSSVQPVFLSESGELMTLPGGVILVLDEDWDSDATNGFLARNGISLDRVSELDYLTNGFLIDTEPGFPSLELANALATQSGVELSSPNWSRERTTR